MPVTLTLEYESLFTDDECRDISQQIVLGIEYCMYSHLPQCAVTPRGCIFFTHPLFSFFFFSFLCVG